MFFQRAFYNFASYIGVCVKTELSAMNIKTKDRKFPKRVKCNALVKRYTKNHLRKYTNMSLSEIYDRLEEQKGIISIDDSIVLEKACSLKPLLRKIAFSKRYNCKFSEYLEAKRDDYSLKLDKLIKILEQGSKPVYYADLAQKKYFDEFYKLGAVINHDTIRAVFWDRIYNSMVCNMFDSEAIEKDVITCYFLSRAEFKKLYRSKEKNPKTQEYKFIDDMYAASRLEDYNTKEILSDIKDLVTFYYNEPSYIYDTIEEEDHIWWRMVNSGYVDDYDDSEYDPDVEYEEHIKATMTEENKYWYDYYDTEYTHDSWYDVKDGEYYVRT